MDMRVVMLMLLLTGCQTTQTVTTEEVGPPKPETTWELWPKDRVGRITTAAMLAFGGWLLVNFLDPAESKPGTPTAPQCRPNEPFPCH